MIRRAAKVDANQEDIVKALRAVGCSVLSLAAMGKGCPDLLVATPFTRRTFLMEIKDGEKIPSKRRLKPTQTKFHAEWRGSIVVVMSVEEALSAI